MCTGYEVGTPCDGNGVDPIEPEFKVEIQDSVFVNLLPLEGSDTLTARDFSAAYEFHNLYDSCRVIYTFSELWQEEERLELSNWDYEHFEKNKNAAQLSALSRSKSFVVTGDTVSYFRSVKWFDPRSGKRQQLVDNFYCTDSLTYIVSMVNELTSARIEVERLLVVSDGSGHIMTSGGLPIAVRKWVPPTGWNGVSAYVDIEITVEGSGLFDPARKDDIVGRLSRALEEPFYSTYYSQFNVSYEVEEEIE
ncbi:MAG: hypothetical protein KDD67_17720 [Ignavibacteriae bacterium]|nr:hypothetical protein [Ignavibacteriota bacterium]MCB9216860.1 hypothetical protein [Ignavibacteria bacterium]